MAEIEISFAKYAQFFFTILEGGKGKRAFFVKMLLTMGQSDNGKAIIEQEFPKETTPKGNIRIKPNKADMLRRYLRGKEESESGNDISNIAPDLESYFDKKQYVEDLEQYENSKLKEFAKALQLEVNLNNPKAVKQAIANCYSSLIKRAQTKKGGTSKESKADPKTDEQNIILSYSITDEEKKAVYRICTAIQTDLMRLKTQFANIKSKNDKLEKLTDSDPDKLYLESHIKSITNQFNETYTDLVLHCSDLNTILAPKKKMNKNFAKLISITNNISRDYKELSYEQYKDIHFRVVISDLSSYIKYSLREIDLQ